MARRVATAEHPNGVDRDHLLFYRAHWESTTDAKALRRNQWLIPPLDRDVHEAKHRDVSFVPILGRYTLSRVVRDFSPVRGDHIASLDELVETINDATHDRRLPIDERRYADFCIDALVRSRPYIVEGLVSPERHLRAV